MRSYFIKKLMHIAKGFLNVKSKYFTHLFNKKRYNTLLAFYNVINLIKNYSYWILRRVLPNDAESMINLKAKMYTVMTVKEFCYQEKNGYTVVENSQPREVFYPIYYGDQDSRYDEYIDAPEVYIAEIDNAEIIGESSVIICGDKCLYDMAKRDDEERYNLRFGSTKNMDSHVAIIEASAKAIFISKAISLVGYASFNYYHFTIEILPRLAYLNHHIELSDIPILVDRRSLTTRQHLELMTLFNKNQNPLIIVDKNQKYKVGTLIYPSYSSWLPINLNRNVHAVPKDFLMSKSAINMIRDVVLANLDVTPALEHTNIFISRRNSKNKRIQNEEELIAISKQHGFSVVYPEEMSLMEQVRLFVNAKTIIGATGAALTNLIYCSEGTRVVCIIPKKYRYFGYSTIAGIVNVKCTFLDADIVSQKQAVSMEEYIVDRLKFDECIKHVLNE